MVKRIERAGLLVVHVCTVVPSSLTVGANRIVLIKHGLTLFDQANKLNIMFERK